MGVRAISKKLSTLVIGALETWALLPTYRTSLISVKSCKRTGEDLEMALTTYGMEIYRRLFWHPLDKERRTLNSLYVARISSPSSMVFRARTVNLLNKSWEIGTTVPVRNCSNLKCMMKRVESSVTDPDPPGSETLYRSGSESVSKIT